MLSLCTCLLCCDSPDRAVHPCVQGVVHVTGGGFYENIPRVFPQGLGCRIDRQAWPLPPLFRWLQQARSGWRRRC